MLRSAQTARGPHHPRGSCAAMHRLTLQGFTSSQMRLNAFNALQLALQSITSAAGNGGARRGFPSSAAASGVVGQVTHTQRSPHPYMRRSPHLASRRQRRRAAQLSRPPRLH